MGRYVLDVGLGVTIMKFILSKLNNFISTISLICKSWIFTGQHGFTLLLKKAGAGHFTKCAPGFLSRFHWRFLAQNLIFYVYQKKFKI